MQGFYRVCLLILLVPLCVIAQDEQPSEEAAADVIPEYRIEMVVFTQPPIDEEVEERAPERIPAFAERMAWPLRDPDAAGLGYAQLPAQEFVLRTAAARLDVQSGFNVLWHGAWIQPGLNRREAQAVALPGELGRMGIRGRVRVYRERFLHAEAQITQRDDRGELVAVMNDSRRMRSGEQHYLDHPRLGVLVRVDPVDD